MNSSAGWLHNPQRLKLRKALFQVHLWSGIALGLYIFFISITGSVLVYRNELYVAATPEPVYSAWSGAILTDSELTEKALLVYPHYSLTKLQRPLDPRQAVEIWLARDDEVVKRLFDPHSGEDLGKAPFNATYVVTGLIELHEEFLAGATGKFINGLCAVAVLLVATTGLILWWPGIKRWRKHLIVHRGAGWKRQVWELHSMIGFWSFGFISVFAFSGIYLCFPEAFHQVAEKIEPLTEENAGNRVVDDALYWLAYSHFGRINGIGIGCDGPGLCDQTVKAVWSIFGLAPALMFITGATMWWNRVLRRWWNRTKSTGQSF